MKSGKNYHHFEKLDVLSFHWYENPDPISGMLFLAMFLDHSFRDRLNLRSYALDQFYASRCDAQAYFSGKQLGTDTPLCHRPDD